MIIVDSIKVEPIGDERRVQIYLPDDFREDEKLPVLYIMDGQNAFSDEESYAGKSWGFVDYVKAHQLRLIMVALDCAMGPYEREKEYGPWPISATLSAFETKRDDICLGGLGISFMKWFVGVFKPTIDAYFPTDCEDTAIVGSSMGGVIASYAAFKYPTIFKKCASLSTAYWFYDEPFKTLIEESQLDQLECFYFDIGSDEGCGDEVLNAMYRQSNQAILTQLQPKLSHLHFRYVGDASHNEWAWAQRLDNFMRLFYEF